MPAFQFEESLLVSDCDDLEDALDSGRWIRRWHDE